MKNIDKENISYKIYLKGLFLFCYYPLTYIINFIPRNRNIWLFGVAVGQRYADNSRVLFEWVNDNCSDVKPIWITKSKKVKKSVILKGYRCCLAYEPAGLYYSLIGQVYVYCSTTSDINHWTSFGSLKINLWHGTPIKKIGWDNTKVNDRDYKIKSSKGLLRFYYRLIYPGFFEEHDIFCTSSDYISKRMMEAWHLKDKSVKVTGYPRNDILFKHKPLEGSSLNINLINEYYGLGHQIVTYLPTYRERTSTPFFIDWNQLQDTLERHHALFVVKFHPFDKTFIDLSCFANIIFLESEIDIYPLLSITSGLVTDYSSVVFDYLVLDRPVIYFAYDLEEYLSKDRDMYENFEEILAGSVANDSTQLIGRIEEEILLGHDGFKEERLKISRKYNRFKDSKNSERVYREIKSML